MPRTQDLLPTRPERGLSVFERLEPDERGFRCPDSFCSREEIDAFIKELKDDREDDDLRLSEDTIPAFYLTRTFLWMAGSAPDTGR